MSIWIPVLGAQGPEDALRASIAAAVSFSPELSTSAGLSCSIKSKVRFTPTLSAATTISTSIAAQVRFAPTLRINDEANVFLSTSIAAKVQFSPTLTAGTGLHASIKSKVQFSPSLTVVNAIDDGFTIYLTILGAAASGAAGARVSRYTARLLANDVPVPISSFSFSSPRDVLGSSLQVELARPLLSEINSAATFEFDLGIWHDGAWQWIPLLQGGLLSGREYQVSWKPGTPAGAPGDSLSFTTLNPLADRWARAPRRPITLYDPTRATIDVGTAQGDVLYDQNGGQITPLLVPISGLSLYAVLNEAYVTGCGFSKVLTNLPNYPVTRTDFSLEAGYHAGVAGLVGMFEPLYAPDDSNNLWIIDRSAPLPAGLAPRDITIDKYSSLSDSAPAPQRTNALILSYTDTESGEFFTTRFDNERVESGHFGAPGFTETTTQRTVREYRDTSDPGTIVREVVTEIKTEVVDEFGNTIHRETQVDSFDGLNRKTGHTREVLSLVPDLAASGDLTLQTVQEEQNTVSYRPHPFRAGQTVQDHSVTFVSGLIHVDNDNQYRDKPFKLPFPDAHRNGFIDPSADQTSEFGPVKTTIESLQISSDSQMTVQVVAIDHLANTTQFSFAQPRTGSAAINARVGKRRRLLLTLPGTAANGRRIPTFDTGDLPPVLARQLGRRYLNKLNSPPRGLSLQFAGLDLSMRRGLPVRAKGRAGADVGTYIIEAISISGSRQDGMLVIRQSAEGSEVAPS